MSFHGTNKVIVKRGQCACCAINVYQGVRLIVKQALNTSKTYIIALLLCLSVHPPITSRAGMGIHSLAGCIRSSTGKSFSAWILAIKKTLRLLFRTRVNMSTHMKSLHLTAFVVLPFHAQSTLTTASMKTSAKSRHGTTVR